MKLKNRALTLILLIIFLCSMVSGVNAATFSDISGTGNEAWAVYRLHGLGILDGYPDGTFKPHETITRAEFAKIVCVTAGLKVVAAGMRGVPSMFSDVSTNHWANGWISVAAAQGYVKGDPNGTFRPDDKITQAEVITVLLRLLGYNDNLPGSWPSDYIAKAANLGVLDKMTFVSHQAASRAIVAILTSAVLDENMVDYLASDNLFKEAQQTYDKKDGNGKILQGYTLMYDKFNQAQSTTDALIINFAVNDSDGMSVFYYTWDEKFTKMSTLKTKKVAPGCSFSGGNSVLEINEHFVDFVVNEDDEIINIAVKNYKKIGPKLSDGSILDELKVDQGKVVIGGNKYSFADSNIATENFEGAAGLLTAAPDKIANQTYSNADAYAVILNENSRVCAIRAWSYPTAGIVDYTKNDRIYFLDHAEPVKNIIAPGIASNAGRWDGFDNTGNFKDGDIFVERDGKPATLKDLQAFDIVNILKEYRGCDYYIVANSTSIDGTLQSAKYEEKDIDGNGSIEADEQFVKQIKVKDVWYDLTYDNISSRNAYKGYYSVDFGKTIEGEVTKETLNDEYNMWNQKVTVLLTASGRVSALIFGGSNNASKMYGVITEVTGPMAYTDGTTVRKIKLMQSDDSIHSYPISEDTYIKKDGPAGAFNKTIKNLSAADSYLGKKYSLNDVEPMIQAFADGTTSLPSGEKVAALVAVTLKSNGIVERMEVFKPISTVLNSSTNLDGDGLLKLESIWLDALDVVVFNLNNGINGPATSVTDLDDTNVVGWKELENNLGTVYAYYVNSQNECKYVVVNSAPMSSGNNYYGIYLDEYSDGSDWVELVGHEAYVLDLRISGLIKGDVVKYSLSGKEIDITKKAIAYGTKSKVSVKNISGHVLALDNGKTFKINGDTQYLDIINDQKLAVLNRVVEGDCVIVIPDSFDTDLAAAVVVVNYSSSGWDGIYVPPSVSSVDVTPDPVTIAPGDTQQMTATVVTTGGAAPTVTWSSSDGTGKVSVDANGLVSVAADAPAGVHAITATSTVEGSKSDFALITVASMVTSVSVTPEAATIAPGGTQQMTATVVTVGGTAQTVTWSSSDGTGKVSVDANGLVSVAADAPEGTHAITATSTVDGAKSDYALVTVGSKAKSLNVEAGISSVNVTPDPVTIAPGGTQQMEATVVTTGGAAQTVTWYSSDGTGKVSVDANGLVSVAADAAAGVHAITAISTVDGSQSDYALVTVTSNVTGVTVTPATAKIAQGGTLQLAATVTTTGAGDQTVKWYSSDINNTVTVDDNGLVKVAANAQIGSVHAILAISTIDGSKAGTCMIEVVPGT